MMPTANLFDHPLSTPQWEQSPAVTRTISTRSLWTAPTSDEVGAPTERIIHQRAVFAERPMRLEGIEFPWGAGYHKCASGAERDRVTSARLFTGSNSGWELVAETDGSAVDLRGLETTAFMAQVRRSATDDWWAGWNLTCTGLVLRGSVDTEFRPSPGITSEKPVIDLGTSPAAGVKTRIGMGEVRFTSEFLDVGFRLARPAWSFLGIDEDGGGMTSRNLLQHPRSMDIVRSGVYPSGVYPVLRDLNGEYLANGPRMTLSSGNASASFLRNDLHVATRVTGSSVAYSLRVGDQMNLELEFEIGRKGIRLHVRRTTTSELRAWHSGIWHVPTDNRVTPSAVWGEAIRTGETGRVNLPLAWHFPRHGTLLVHGHGDLRCRSDSVRPLDTNTLELKLDETVSPMGDYLIKQGTSEGSVSFEVAAPTTTPPTGQPSDTVKRMLSRHTLTALSYRPDTDTYSNNGASMHCTTSLNDVSALAELTEPPVEGGPHPMSLVGNSLERWLTGAPSYGSGRTSHGGHLLDDEYIQMAADTLLALGRYLRWESNPSWGQRHRTAIVDRIEQMLARDADSDGLLESSIRKGISGEHQWSTSWSDVISFGWKDAWANAIAYRAYALLVPELHRLGEDGLADRVASAQHLLRANYKATFYNPATGWIAGWVSPDGTLHDYAFPMVNGAACCSDLLDLNTAHRAMRSMWDELGRVGFRDLTLGLPLNLHRIPEEDIGGVIFGLPMGSYQQGGASHHRIGDFLRSLRRVGMRGEANRLLEAVAGAIANDEAFGGLGSGVDWRSWDGTPTGYEGQLVEGFAVLSSALEYDHRPEGDE